MTKKGLFKMIKKCMSIIFLMSVSFFAQANEILSKSDAAQMFSTPLNAWIQNLETIKNSGQGTFAKASEFEYTMYFGVEGGIIAVTPSYTSKKTSNPYKITMTTIQKGMDAGLISNLSNNVLKDMIKKWYLEMLPEYTVMTKFEIDPNVVSTTFSIFQANTVPHIDEVAKNTNGCWQECIQRK